jgi:hypothetical protein
MKEATRERGYRPTELKLKGRAETMYLTYDLEQRTRGGGSALYPKVKRVYIAGEVTGWEAGVFQKRSGREVYGVKIDYEQRRERYHRKGYTASRGKTQYHVSPTDVPATTQKYSQVVELPREAQNVRLHADAKPLPEKYRDALQDVR